MLVERNFSELCFLLTQVHCLLATRSMAESVKVPVFSVKSADFPLFRTRFTAFVDAVGCDAALDSEGEDDAAQQKKLYSLLVLALPETTLHVIRKVRTCWLSCLASFAPSI